MAKKNGKTNWYLTIGICLFLVAIALIVCFFMRGETKTNGGFPEPEVSESLSCEIEGLVYPLSGYDNSERKTTKVSMVFDDDKLKTISLIYQLYYNNNEEIAKSETENHAAMNLRMQSEGLGPDALGMNFAKLSNNLKMSLYAKVSELDSGSAKYFELENVNKYDLDVLKKFYEQKGFGCIAKNG